MKRFLLLSTLLAGCSPTTFFAPKSPKAGSAPAIDAPLPTHAAPVGADDTVGPRQEEAEASAPKAAETPAKESETELPATLRDALKLSVERGLTTSSANPSEATIKSISYAGSGCPANSVAANVSPDLKALTLAFDQYTASIDGSFNVAIGPGLDPGDARRNCLLNIELDVPAGYTYTLFRMDVRGFMSVESGIRGTIQSDFYFQGEQSKTVAFKDVTEGPHAGDFELRLEPKLGVDVVEQPWSTCAGEPRSLNINTQIYLTRTSSSVTGRGHIALDSVDGVLVHQYGIKWEKCLPPPPPPPPSAGATLINVYPYDVLAVGMFGYHKDSQPTLRNRIYFHDFVRDSWKHGFKIVLPYFSAFPSPTGTPGQQACDPVQMMQCVHRPNGVYYSWVQSCLPGDQTIPIGAWICRAPVAGKTSPLHLLYSPTYGSITSHDAAFRDALIRDFKFHDLGLIGHAPIADL